MTVILRLRPHTSATARYRLWWMVLTAVMALPGLQSLAAGSVVPTAVTISTGSPYLVQIPVLPSWPLVVAFTVYGAWICWWLGHLGYGLRRLRMVKRHCGTLPPDLENRLQRWPALREQGRRTRLVVSDDVRSVGVLGLTSPVIALSPLLLESLTDDELDCILVHEWAHVQRRDDVARVVQIVVRAIAGLHPAVWWIDRQLRLDREIACDDWAINLTGSSRRYARCLTKVAALDLARRDSTLLVAAVPTSGLTRRVMRLLDHARSTSTTWPAAATACALPLLIATATVVAAIQLVVPSAPVTVLAVRRDPPAALPPAADAETRHRNVSQTAELEPRMSRLQRPAPVRPVPVQPPADGKALQGQVVHRITDLVAARSITFPAALPTARPFAGDTQTAGTSSEVGDSSGKPDPPVAVPPPPVPAPSAAWREAAEIGVSVGRKSQQAAVSTAGFFSRLGKSIADGF
jgi:beta-lactamase regulating signal transducer with metallopeptidase domain